MKPKLKYKLRKKGIWKDGNYKYILEKRIDNKIVKVMTLPKPDILWGLLSPVQSDGFESSFSKESVGKHSVKQYYTNSEVEKKSLKEGEDLIKDIFEKELRG